MFNAVKKLALELGFGEVYALPPAPISCGPLPEGLTADPAGAYPNATALLLLVYPYCIFPMEERIPAYYLASHASYHAMKGLCAQIAGLGGYAEAARVPLRSLALSNGIGELGRNGLLRIHPYGPALILHAVATDICAPAPFLPPERRPCPPDCLACSAACPGGAITAAGLEQGRCMRKYMDTAAHPDWVKERQLYYIGCEACIRACPFAAAGGAAQPTAEQRAAFDTRALIQGNSRPARELVGRNMTGGGRLTAEAIAFAARDGLYREETAAAADSPFEAVRAAAAWAMARGGA